MKNNYIVTARVDGEKRHFTVHAVTEKKLPDTAREVAISLFSASSVLILENEVVY